MEILAIKTCCPPPRLPHRPLLGPRQPLLRHQGAQRGVRARWVGAGWDSDWGRPQLAGGRGRPGQRRRAHPRQRHPRHAHLGQLHALVAWRQTVCILQRHSGGRLGSVAAVAAALRGRGKPAQLLNAKLSKLFSPPSAGIRSSTRSAARGKIFPHSPERCLSRLSLALQAVDEAAVRWTARS